MYILSAFRISLYALNLLQQWIQGPQHPCSTPCRAHFPEPLQHPNLVWISPLLCKHFHSHLAC